MNRFRAVGVIAKRRDPHLATTAAVCDTLNHLGCEVLLEANPALGSQFPHALHSREALAGRCDLVVVVGGDGTLLDAGRALAPAGLPIVGVNQGRLGFMADVNPEALGAGLASIVAGEAVIEERLMLVASICRGTLCVSTGLAVNDVVIRNQATIRMLEYETWMDEEFISAHRADGLIVATPTGSTAYALSGGGPLIHPSMSAIALVPICPHTLSDRPIVVGGESVIRVVVRPEGETRAMVTIDGQAVLELCEEDSVEVRRAPHPLRLIHPPGHSHFRILRNKLRWGSGPDALLERA